MNTKSKHTPGQWSYQAYEEGGAKVIIGDYDAGFGEEGPEFREADARLIAAAPELLEVCKVILDAYDKPEFDGTFDWPEAARILRAAIAKAEGK